MGPLNPSCRHTPLPRALAPLIGKKRQLGLGKIKRGCRQERKNVQERQERKRGKESVAEKEKSQELPLVSRSWHSIGITHFSHAFVVHYSVILVFYIPFHLVSKSAGSGCGAGLGWEPETRVWP